LGLFVSAATCAAGETPVARVTDAPELVLPGVSAEQHAGQIDCNSPAHWDDETLYVFMSTGHPYRSSGPGMRQLAPSVRVSIDNEKEWKEGGRWIEATHKADDGHLYAWYHNEPPKVCPDLPGRTAPRIGAMVSKDNGLHWRDLGLVLTAPPDSLNCQTVNHYFAGGNGDFSVILDRKKEYLYFLISTYNRDMSEQGVAIARMPYADRDKPIGKVRKWHKGKWESEGLGGHVTPMFKAAIDWHKAEVDAFWGPSIHWNTHLEQWVMLLNRAKDKMWAQEGIYVSFNPDLDKPESWSRPVRLLDAPALSRSKWYPQVIGLDASRQETDKLAGRRARLFIAGVSKWEISFLKPDERPE
jgi:hypothetical protein